MRNGGINFFLIFLIDFFLIVLFLKKLEGLIFFLFCLLFVISCVIIFFVCFVYFVGCVLLWVYMVVGVVDLVIVIKILGFKGNILVFLKEEIRLFGDIVFR